VVATQHKEHLIKNLLINVINTLKSKDTKVRDIARECLAKMIETLGVESLKSVIYEMQHILKEGYQRHICNYSIRFLLTKEITITIV
jgi:hypothetical protein